MCEYLSFGIPKVGELDIYVGESTTSHQDMAELNKIPENSYYEAEWIEDDKGATLKVRIETDDEELKDKKEKLVLSSYKTRQLLEIEVWKKICKLGGSLDLYLSGTQIKKLPDNLKVGGYLDLQGTEITKLPDGLKVVGYLDLRGSQITELPDNLKVDGGLYLCCTKITKLPDGLKVGGSLDLSNTPITELPDNLKVGGDLYLSNTPITELPDNLKVVGTIYKDF